LALEHIAENLQTVRGRMAAAAGRAGRDPDTITLIAVSKTFSVDHVRAAWAAGQRDFGENKVQEALQKIAATTDIPVRWHLIGHLQSNKVARAIALFEGIQSVDSLELARRIGRIALEAGRAPFPVYLEVNVDADPRKAGFRTEEAMRVAPEIGRVSGLRIDGLMTVGRLVTTPEDARPTFTALHNLSGRMRAIEPAIGAGLSMGMSDDFEVAVEEGATVVRLGRALFGERPAN
jgi:pyridoxal phosphate enzyme (YggS family)